jgi:hypothetical protein
VRALAAAALAALAAGGCQVILGLDDPQLGTPDGNGCVRATCDLTTNCGCQAAETCTWDAAQQQTYCRAQSGVATLGQACSLDIQCGPGLSCVLGECRNYCDQNTFCGTGRHCVADFIPLVPDLVCSDGCSPITDNGCGTGLTCIAIQGKDASTCIPDNGTITTGNVCTNDAFSCVKGDVCYDINGTGFCLQQYIAANAGACFSTNECDINGDLTVNSAVYGTCAP